MKIWPEGPEKKEYNFGGMQLQLALLGWSVSLDGQKEAREDSLSPSHQS